MNRSMLGVITAAVAVLAIAGIFVATRDKDIAPTTNTTSSQTTTNTTDTPSATNEDSEVSTANQVEIRNFAYSPATIKVKKGTTVTWTNRDTTEHTVTPSDEGTFEGSDLLARGETFSVTFDKVGTFKYFCEPHPEMTGTVVVEE